MSSNDKIANEDGLLGSDGEFDYYEVEPDEPMLPAWAYALAGGTLFGFIAGLLYGVTYAR